MHLETSIKLIRAAYVAALNMTAEISDEAIEQLADEYMADIMPALIKQHEADFLYKLDKVYEKMSRIITQQAELALLQQCATYPLKLEYVREDAIPKPPKAYVVLERDTQAHGEVCHYCGQLPPALSYEGFLVCGPCNDHLTANQLIN